jgi:hypothetical protein
MEREIYASALGMYFQPLYGGCLAIGWRVKCIFLKSSKPQGSQGSGHCPKSIARGDSFKALHFTQGKLVGQVFCQGQGAQDPFVELSSVFFQNPKCPNESHLCHQCVWLLQQESKKRSSILFGLTGTHIASPTCK